MPVIESTVGRSGAPGGPRVHTDDMAKDYESEAHVVVDGEEFPVYARFTIHTEGGLKAWHGSLGSDEPELGFKLIKADRLQLRMPDGKEGTILATRASDGEATSFTGSGPAPV